MTVQRGAQRARPHAHATAWTVASALALWALAAPASGWAASSAPATVSFDDDTVSDPTRLAQAGSGRPPAPPAAPASSNATAASEERAARATNDRPEAAPAQPD